MNNRQDPFFTIEGLIELLYQIIVILKHLANAKNLFFIRINTMSGDILEIDIKEWHRVGNHISWKSIRQIISARIVIFLNFVLLKNLLVFLLVILSTIGT